MRSVLIATVALVLTLCSQAHAGKVADNIQKDAFWGVEKAELQFDGKTYVFPVGTLDRKQEIYLINKAMLGDEIALDMLLGTSEEKWFFIGMEKPLWLHITRNGMKIVEP